MGSPIGGFYLSAHQRQRRKLAEYDARVAMMLSLTLMDSLNQDEPLMEINEKVYIGTEYQFGSDAILYFTSAQLESGLFQVSFGYKQTQQTLTLSESEPVSSQLADAENIKVLVEFTATQDC